MQGQCMYLLHLLCLRIQKQLYLDQVIPKICNPKVHFLLPVGHIKTQLLLLFHNFQGLFWSMWFQQKRRREPITRDRCLHLAPVQVLLKLDNLRLSFLLRGQKDEKSKLKVMSYDLFSSKANSSWLWACHGLLRAQILPIYQDNLEYKELVAQDQVQLRLYLLLD
jgi:hypothetical protein